MVLGRRGKGLEKLGIDCLAEEAVVLEVGAVETAGARSFSTTD